MMHRTISVITLLLILAAHLYAQGNPKGYEENWHQWRGPSADGIAPDGDPPVKWSEEMNVHWKVEMPGIGHATPVIWGDQIILLSAVQTDKEIKPEQPEEQEENSWMSPVKTNFVHNFDVLSINREDGSIQWQTTVRAEVPHSHTHEFGSWASHSPVTDGEKIYAYFGSHGLYCLNMDGEILWERDFGHMQKVRSFGEGSSPVIYDDRLILVRDHQGQSFLHVLNKHTGEDLLEIERDEITSWPTPQIVDFGGRTQVITSATNKIRSYDLASGEVIWECSGMTRNVIPSPVLADNIIYLLSGFRGSAALAIDLSKADGDITDKDAIVWKYDMNTPYTPSPVTMDGKLFFLKSNNGFLTCLDGKDGTALYSSQKLEGINRIFTSPVGVRNRIYIVGTNGVTSVVKTGSEFEELSKNTLDDSFYASPVILGDKLFLRGNRYLYCIAEK